MNINELSKERELLRDILEKHDDGWFDLGSILVKDIKKLLAQEQKSTVWKILDSSDESESLLDEHFRDRIDVYAEKHPTLLVRQLAQRLRTEYERR